MTVNWEVRRRRLAEYYKQEKQIEAAWFEALRRWEKQGLKPGTFTAFAEGYKVATEPVDRADLRDAAREFCDSREDETGSIGSVYTMMADFARHIFGKTALKQEAK